MKAMHLQDEKYMLLTDSQDIDDVCSDFPELDRTAITGALVVLGDGDYDEVWVTESSTPYSVYADYDCVRLIDS